MESMFNFNPDKVFTVDEISDLLRLNRLSVIRAILKGDLVACKLGQKSYRISGKALKDYIDSKMVKPE